MPERNGRTGRAPVLLVVVLLLVLGAFGLLVVALVTGHNGWAWGSVAASAVAGVLLVTDWIARPKVTAPQPAVPGGWSADEEVAPAERATAEPVDPSGGDTSRMAGPSGGQTSQLVEPSGGDTSQMVEGDTPQASAAERMEIPAQRTGPPEPEGPSPDPG